jgi:hypothetical protein
MVWLITSSWYSLLADAEMTTIATPGSCDTRSKPDSGSEKGKLERIFGVRLLCWSKMEKNFRPSRLHKSPNCGRNREHNAS